MRRALVKLPLILFLFIGVAVGINTTWTLLSGGAYPQAAVVAVLTAFLVACFIFVEDC